MNTSGFLLEASRSRELSDTSSLETPESDSVCRVREFFEAFGEVDFVREPYDSLNGSLSWITRSFSWSHWRADVSLIM